MTFVISTKITTKFRGPIVKMFKYRQCTLFFCRSSICTHSTGSVYGVRSVFKFHCAQTLIHEPPLKSKRQRSQAKPCQNRAEVKWCCFTNDHNSWTINNFAVCVCRIFRQLFKPPRDCYRTLRSFISLLKRLLLPHHISFLRSLNVRAFRLPRLNITTAGEENKSHNGF